LPTPAIAPRQNAGGARNQLTFSAEPVGGASFRPRTGECIVFSQDSGGGEFFQLSAMTLPMAKQLC